MDPALQELYAEGDPDDEVAVVLRLADETRVPEGVRLVTRFGDIATGRVRRSDILRLHASEFVKSVKAPRRYLPGQSDPAEPGWDLAPLPTDVRRPSTLEATGQGVLIGHIDWGADFTAADFRTSDGRTRFRAIWDQGAAYDPAHPNRYGYGRVHLAADIDRALAQPDPFTALGYDPASAAPAGGSHGTHTLGISAGNGRSGGPAGMAPDADLAFVDMSTRHDAGMTGLGDSAALLEALDFFAALANDGGRPQPLVVNASLGRQCGQHDGKTLTERGMDAFALAAPGRAICQSAGNYFDRRMHSQGTLLPGETRELHVSIDNAHPVRHEIDLWYPGEDRIEVAIRGPGIEPIEVGPNARGVLVCAGSVVGRIYHRLHDPNNGDNEITLFLDPHAPSGEWQLSLHGRDIVDGRYHAWIERGEASRALFAPGEEQGCTTTGTIANGLRSISVGAYDAHDAQRTLAHFSSGGPTRNGRRKPDLVAPGMRVLSVRSRAADEARADPPLLRLSGTSMAAPSVTGAVALMFSVAAQPLTIEETRRLLLSSTQPPPESVSGDSMRFGCGYLDAAAAVRAVRASLASESSETAAIDNDPLHPWPPENHVMSTEPVAPPPLPNLAAVADLLVALLPPDLLAAITAARRAANSDPSERFVESDRSISPRAFRAANRPADPGFQVQVPITGGAPALALPFGGAASPFAFTIPLGGSPPPQTPMVVTASASPAPAASPAVDTSAGGYGTVGVAADTPLFVPGEFAETQQLAGCMGCRSNTEPPANQDANRDWVLALASPTLLSSAPRSRNSLQWLLSVLGAAHNEMQTMTLLPWLRSATALFNAFVYPEHREVRQRFALPRLLEHFRVLARPFDSIEGLVLRPGDTLVRVSLGQAHSHLAVVASQDVAWHHELAQRNWTGEGYPAVEPGVYVTVIEPLPHPRTAAERFARRIADARRCVLADTLLLRPVALDRRADALRAPYPTPRGGDLVEQAADPDSPVADRFIAADASRFCSPGQAGSATCSHLPSPRPIRRIIIHVLAVRSTAERSGVDAVVAAWQSADRQAASHYLVDRDGSITQMVREADVAFHTPGNNADSIGIEHADVCNDPTPLTDRLYERSADLVRDIAARNGFTADGTTVRGHSQVNPNHDDPGPYWDWEFYSQWLAWSKQSATRPCRRVAAMSALPTPSGWQVHQRRAISTEFCADARDSWGGSFVSASNCDASMTPAEVTVVLEEIGSYSISLWWPKAADAAATAAVDVEIACMQSPCVGTSLQSVVVDQTSRSGQWNAIAVVNVTRAPSELKVRWRCPVAGAGRVLADAVRALKIATVAPQSTWPAATPATPGA